MDEPKSRPLNPVWGIRAEGAYSVPRSGAPTDLKLDGNEGRGPGVDAADVLGRAGADALRLYPKIGALEARLAGRLGVEPERVVVTAGADDAILRVCTALLGPERELVLPAPTFEMIDRYAALRGCRIREVEWRDGPYPIDAVLAATGPATAVIAVVTPNNPTGAVATSADLARLAEAAPQALVLVDQAYVEFADEDLAPLALTLPNAVVLQTLSKAWGLAGLRVGYAAGPRDVVGWLRQAGNPYPVSAASIAIAEAVLDDESEPARLAAFVDEVRRERRLVEERLRARGVRCAPSQANFVLARFDDALWVRDAMAGMGIAIRAFPGRARLEDALRITLPGDPAECDRLVRAFDVVLAPEAVLSGVPVAGQDARVHAVDPAVNTPEALRARLAEIGVERAWYLGDNVEAIRAARAAGLLPVGLSSGGVSLGDPSSGVASDKSSSGDGDPLVAAGAARRLERAEDILELLP